MGREGEEEGCGMLMGVEQGGYGGGVCVNGSSGTGQDDE